MQLTISSSSCSWRFRRVSLFLDPPDEVRPSISSSVALCSFFLSVCIAVLVLVFCLCPFSVRVVASYCIKLKIVSEWYLTFWKYQNHHRQNLPQWTRGTSWRSENAGRSNESNVITPHYIAQHFQEFYLQIRFHRKIWFPTNGIFITRLYRVLDNHPTWIYSGKLVRISLWRR
jgi:hypothetical protein